jgi:hypothetical protein
MVFYWQLRTGTGNGPKIRIQDSGFRIQEAGGGRRDSGAPHGRMREDLRRNSTIGSRTRTSSRTRTIEGEEKKCPGRPRSRDARRLSFFAIVPIIVLVLELVLVLVSIA